jgi:hypothetical protein
VDEFIGLGRLQDARVVSGIPLEGCVLVYAGQALTRWEPPIQQLSDSVSKTNSVKIIVFSYTLMVDVSYKYTVGAAF